MNMFLKNCKHCKPKTPHTDLSPDQQQRQIKIRAFSQMALGTLLVLVFSDPAVEVLGEIGNRTGINAFYISFVLAPLASNASELVAAYMYGCKKTSAMMTVSLSTLEGAAIMNNTFCLAIFYMLIHFQRLAWTFSAET
jgi:Ca2+/Na+ antiporter